VGNADQPDRAAKISGDEAYIAHWIRHKPGELISRELAAL
jgi:hypothetical protein